MTLYISCDDDNLRSLLGVYLNVRRDTDSGFDIPMLQKNVRMNNPLEGFPLGIKICATDDLGNPTPCLLLPRSSLSFTPFRLANSIGLIDSGFRGELRAMVDINLTKAINQNDVYTIHNGTRLFQICQHNFLPWTRVEIVDVLPAAADNRGSEGFGSTG
jgi:dUTP pyrophosphatase